MKSWGGTIAVMLVCAGLIALILTHSPKDTNKNPVPKTSHSTHK